MGPARGRLAVTLDVLTDALVLVGQHGVYCQSTRQPGKPAMDIQAVAKSIADAKELIAGKRDGRSEESGRYGRTNGLRRRLRTDRRKTCRGPATTVVSSGSV